MPDSDDKFTDISKIMYQSAEDIKANEVIKIFKEKIEQITKSFEKTYQEKLEEKTNEIKKDLTEKKEKRCEEIEENIVKISKEIIRTIKEFNNFEDKNIIAFIENRYCLIETKENAGKKISELLKLQDKEIENSGITIYYNNKEEKKELKLSIKEKNNTEIEYSARLQIRISENNSINSILDKKKQSVHYR